MFYLCQGKTVLRGPVVQRRPLRRKPVLRTGLRGLQTGPAPNGGAPQIISFVSPLGTIQSIGRKINNRYFD